ncbi:MAG: polymer-forming cytoskeletal protein [Silvibacterium sp.]
MPVAEATAASIGKSVQIYGEVKGSEDLLVDGTIEGTITLSESRLTIGPHAHVQANVSARDVVILGALTGDIIASGRVELRAGCNLKGDIQAGRLSIEENALFSGKVDLTATPAGSSDKASSASSGTAAPSPSAPGALLGSSR